MLTGGMLGGSTRAGLGSCSVVTKGESMEDVGGSAVEGEGGLDEYRRGVVRG